MSAATDPAVCAHVLIAVKDLRRAKSRLAPRMDTHDRARLALAMLRDTLVAVRASELVAGVTVVTPDPLVAATASDLGATVFPDPGDRDLNEVLTAAARSVGRGERVMALQGDLPCLSGGELTAALRSAAGVRRAVVVDHHGTGTSALVGTAESLDPMFGIDSASHHIRSGATNLNGEWPGLRLDVDTPEDLDAAVALGTGAATTEALHEMHVDHSPGRC